MIKNGDKVEILESGILGTVTGVCIRGVENQTFEYEVTYMSGGTIQCQWTHGYLLKPHKDTKRKAGLVNYDDQQKQLT